MSDSHFINYKLLEGLPGAKKHILLALKTKIATLESPGWRAWYQRLHDDIKNGLLVIEAGKP